MISMVSAAVPPVALLMAAMPSVMASVALAVTSVPAAISVPGTVLTAEAAEDPSALPVVTGGTPAVVSAALEASDQTLQNAHLLFS